MKLKPTWKSFESLTSSQYFDLLENRAELVNALKTWKKFWDTMPKGQMGKLAFDVGLFNQGFLKMGKALANAEGGSK